MPHCDAANRGYETELSRPFSVRSVYSAVPRPLRQIEMCDSNYPDAYHQWNWFRRRQWWPDFRDRMLASKGGSCGAVLEALGGPQGRLVLDATCGLGRKTLVFSHLGAEVMGSDVSAYAVERARELAESEERQICLYVSSWQELPDRAPCRFDAVFVDAFQDCIGTEDELRASFSGILDVLNPGGIFTTFGPEPGERPSDILQQAWESAEQFTIEWRHSAGDCDCTCLHARTKGEDFIDEHHLYLIREMGAEPRLETATIRRWFRWDRSCLDDLAHAAGFSDVWTQPFPGYGFGGTTFSRIIARK